MQHIYRVTFERQINSCIDQMVFHCYANNQKEAKAYCERMWSRKHYSGNPLRPGHCPHQFHMEAKRTECQNPELLEVTTLIGNTYSGEDVIDQFYCTESKYWRRSRRNELPFWIR